MEYADDPLVFRTTDSGGNRVNLQLVKQQLTGHLMWNLGLWDHLVIFMDIPYQFIVKSGGEASDVLTGTPFESLLASGSGMGDTYLGARGNLYGTRDDVFEIALQATMTISTASVADSEQNYRGQPDVSPYLGGWFELLMTFNPGDLVRIPLNFGYKLNNTQSLSDQDLLALANEATWGAGLQVLVAQDKVMLTAEGFGRTSLGRSDATAGFANRENSPIEVLGGVKYFHPKGFVVGAAGSAGVHAGYGAPDWRATGMIAYTMPERAPVLDTDGDGLLDPDDACPNEPEDFDGFQDEDGCPDLDNDGDGILDVDDECPNEPEDFDGFEDEDGCPDPDNDGDGILDVDDACPNEPGPAVTNGCPEPDRDGDSVPDRTDNCPDEPGTVANQGCQEPQLVLITTEQLKILEKVYFRLNSAQILPRAFPLLDNIAAVIRAHPEIGQIRIEGHTDRTGTLGYNMKLSKRRAGSVVEYLVGKGVSKDRLVAEGFGPTRPVVPDAKTKAELAKNRRVEFHIVEPEKDSP
ncbi:MAG: OmpA family protein [Deltaproteobacteria bacterium]|nr:OmpA family protein [Deltaproteobacteria bacterium]